MIPAKFSELNLGDNFIHNHKRFTKIIPQQIEIISCCNFPVKTIVNAKNSDGKLVYFSPDEDIIMVER